MLIEQGSIGSNPISEPVGDRWMKRADTEDAVEKIRILLTPFPGCSKEVARIQIERGVALCRELQEPMIYEQLLEGYTCVDGKLHHPQRNNPWERSALEALVKTLPREVMLGRSFFE